MLTDLSGEQLKEAKQTELFWEVQATMYGACHESCLQRARLFEGVLLHPKFANLKAYLLWLMIINGENQQVKMMLSDLYEVRDEPVLWHAYAAGLDILNRYTAALLMYQSHLNPPVHDDQAIIEYANVLDRAKYHKEAFQQRLSLWQQIMPTFIQMTGEEGPGELQRETLEILGQLAPYFLSGTEQFGILSALMSDNPNQEDLNILLNWAVSKRYFDLVAYLKAFYLNESLPDWAGINLALNNHDLPTLQAIMEHTERSWPRADRINAAVSLENTNLANDLAFAELTDRPLAHEIYREFTQYALADAGHIRMREDYEKFINIVGGRTLFETRLRLSNSLKITPYTHRT